MRNRKRWNGIRGASVAVAGVCLSSSLASASVAGAEDVAFESEFELPAELIQASEPVEITSSPAVEVSVIQFDIAIAEAGEDGSAELAISCYLDRLVRRAEDIDVLPECLPETPTLAAVDLYDVLGDVDEETEAAWKGVMDELAGTPRANEIAADDDARDDLVDVLADADEATEAAWKGVMDELAGTPRANPIAEDDDARADLIDVLADADEATEAAWREVMSELAGTPSAENPAASVEDKPAVPELSATDVEPEEDENFNLDFFP